MTDILKNLNSYKINNENKCYSYTEDIKNKKLKCHLEYKYEKENFKQLNFIKNTKTEIRKYVKYLKQSLLMNDRENPYVVYVIQKKEEEDDNLMGNMSYIYENIVKFIGEEYIYLYNGKQYTKKFSNDILVRFIEIFCILNNVISLVNPYIEIIHINSLIEQMKLDKDKDNYLFNHIIEDKKHFIKNGKTTLRLINSANKNVYCDFNYHYIFSIMNVV